MGISLTQWRSRVGCYLLSNSSSPKIKTNVFDSVNFSLARYKLLLCVITILLIIGNVESNPGPPKVDSQLEQQNDNPPLSLESLANMILDLKCSLNVKIE